MKRRPRKIIMRVLVCLLLGAIVNVAVAWRYSMHWGFPEKPMTSASDGKIDFVQVSLLGVTLTERNLQTGSWDSATWSVQNNIESGIPFRSMTGSRTVSNSRVMNRTLVWEPDLPMIGHRSFTCGILPMGFAANTLIYAVVLWMMFAFPFVVRGRRRLKRGLCPACTYPVGGSPVCTECGMLRLRREHSKTIEVND